MKIDRDPNRPVRHLTWRVRFLGAGAVLAVAGMALESTWLVNVAIVVLVAGFALRYWPDEAGPESPEEDEPDV